MTKKQMHGAQGIIGGLFALAVIYFIAGIVIDKKTGPVKAQERFDALAYETRTLAAKYEPTSDAFKNAFTPLIGSLDDFAALQLSLNNQPLYQYDATVPSDTATISLSDETKTLLGNTLTISALLYSFKPQAVFTHANVSFVLIVLGTLGAIVLLVIVQYKPLTVTHKKAKKHAESIIILDDEEAETENETDDEEQSEAFADAVADSESEPIADTAEDEEESTDDDDFDPIGEMEEDNRLSAEEDVLVFADEPSEEAQESEDIIDFFEKAEVTDEAEHTEPERSASPQDNAQDEETAQDEYEQENETPDAITIALDNEIADAIANEQDIAALIIQLQGLTLESTAATNLKKLLTDRLGKQGIVGDHNGNIALIVKNTNLDTALAFAQSLNNAVAVILERSGETAQTAIGISARSFRMINAIRLLTEAEQAALHADKENPIIAFRVNPEKYKQYVQEEM